MITILLETHQKKHNIQYLYTTFVKIPKVFGSYTFINVNFSSASVNSAFPLYNRETCFPLR